MSISRHISDQIRETFHGGSWTGSNFKECIEDITWEESMIKVDSFNTIASLIFHVNFFIEALLTVLNNQELTASDKNSFDLPPIENVKGWEDLTNKLMNNADQLTDLISKLPDEKLEQDFWQNKYGNFYRNIQGVIQHSYYHLGQIALIKKKIR